MSRELVSSELARRPARLSTFVGTARGVVPVRARAEDRINYAEQFAPPIHQLLKMVHGDLFILDQVSPEFNSRTHRSTIIAPAR